MTYLSRVMVHKQEAARQQLRDSYAWHRALWDAFPGRDDAPRHFLFRLDEDHPRFRVLLLSLERPTLPEWGQWATKEIAGGFLDHDRYRFQIRANPTMRRVSDRRRVGIYAEPRLRDWFQRKAGDHGFAVEPGALSLSAPLDAVFFREGRRGKHVSVDFQGTLDVTDRPAFKAAFETGIGPAKAFGFGMMMLQPVGAK